MCHQWLHRKRMKIQLSTEEEGEEEEEEEEEEGGNSNSCIYESFCREATFEKMFYFSSHILGSL